jgi:hypothetical protein
MGKRTSCSSAGNRTNDSAVTGSAPQYLRQRNRPPGTWPEAAALSPALPPDPAATELLAMAAFPGRALASDRPTPGPASHLTLPGLVLVTAMQGHS